MTNFRTGLGIACTVIVVLFFLYVWASFFTGRDSVSMETAQEIAELTVIVKDNTQALSAIRKDLEILDKKRGQLVQVTGDEGGIESRHSAEIISRIEALEIRLDEASQILNRRANGQVRHNKKMFKDLSKASLDNSTGYMPNTFGETVFENDEGKPLGDNADTVSDVFYDIGDSIQLSSLDCKESVCKVSYSHVRDENNETASYDDPNSDIVDRLVEGFGGADLDISYARNADGDDVMYIQVQ